MLAKMSARIVHLCYAGTSGSTRAAVNIAHGSAEPARHAYVFYGAVQMRDDYRRELQQLGCQWTCAHKPRGPGIFAGKSVARAIEQLSPAVVVFHGSRSLPILRHFRRLRPYTPTIAVQHGPSREIISPWRRWVCKKFSQIADRTVVVSNDLFELIRSYYSLAKACRPITVIHNGLDVDFWYAQPVQIPRDRSLRVVMTATFSDYKDQPTLLRALARLKERGLVVTVDLVGAGPTEKRLRRLAAKLGLQSTVRFRGNLPRDAVRETLHSADVLVHTTRSESFGMSVVEGMLAGRCVIATACTGINEIVTDGQTGLLVPDGDAQAVAKALRKVIENPKMAVSLARAAQSDAREKFACDRTARAYEQLADEMPGNNV